MSYSPEDMSRFRDMMNNVGEQDIRNPARYMEILDSRIGLGEEALDDLGYGNGPGNRARSMASIVEAMAYCQYGIKPDQLKDMDPNFVMGLMAGATMNKDMQEMFGFRQAKQPPRLLTGVKNFCRNTREMLQKERQAEADGVEPVAEVDLENGEKGKVRTVSFFKRWYSDMSAHMAAGLNKVKSAAKTIGHDAVALSKAGAGYVKDKALDMKDDAVAAAKELPGKAQAAGKAVGKVAYKMAAPWTRAIVGAGVKGGKKVLSTGVKAGKAVASAGLGAVERGADAVEHGIDKVKETGRKGAALGRSLGDMLPRIQFSRPNKSLSEWCDQARSIISGDAPETEAVNIFNATEVTREADVRAGVGGFENEARMEQRATRNSHELDNAMSRIRDNVERSGEYDINYD